MDYEVPGSRNYQLWMAAAVVLEEAALPESDVLNALKVQIEVLANEMKNIGHDVKGALQEMKTYASQRELDRVVMEFKEKMAQTDSAVQQKFLAAEIAANVRFKPLEDVLRYTGRTVAGVIIVALLGLVIKTGIH
jgi:hypothetical protein